MIKVSSEKDQVVVAKAYSAGQDHVFRYWEELDEPAKKRLLRQVADIDFQLIHDLSEQFMHCKTRSRIFKNFLPPDTVAIPRTPEEEKASLEARAVGEEAMRDGRVAIVMVAGGQATRLGYDGPKGTYPIGPVSGKSLFQIHAEKILALHRKFKAPLHWHIMTSENSDAATREFFDRNKYFGMGKNTVHFFTQQMIPAVDKRGKLMLVDKDTIFRNPDGHGGVFTALRENGILDELAGRGVTDLFYFQVDNPLVKIADPVFIGRHIRASSQMSLKCIKKDGPGEKMGAVGYLDGKLTVVEYSELTEDDMHAADENGELVFGLGSPAIHMLNREFIERITSGDFHLPYHKAEKVIPYLDKNGEIKHPDKPNGVKFETFIFDALPEAKKTLVVEADRAEEFSPVKSIEGPNTPDDAKQALTNLFGKWLEAADMAIPRNKEGDVTGKIEISPLYAMSAEELKEKVDPSITFSGALYLS